MVSYFGSLREGAQFGKGFRYDSSHRFLVTVAHSIRLQNHYFQVGELIFAQTTTLIIYPIYIYHELS
jgi:hypothetical protein